MSIEVFIRCAPQGSVRDYLSMACIDRWLLDGVQPKIIAMKGSKADDLYRAEVLPEENFHWECRICAEEDAQGPYYILCDDDTLILGDNWAKRAVATAKDAEADLASGNSVIHSERNGELASSNEFIYKHGTGCPCVIRKGAIDWKSLSGPANEQDGIIGKYMAEHHLTAGVMKNLDYIHAGMGLSQVEPKLFLRY